MKTLMVAVKWLLSYTSPGYPPLFKIFTDHEEARREYLKYIQQHQDVSGEIPRTLDENLTIFDDRTRIVFVRKDSIVYDETGLAEKTSGIVEVI